MTHIRALVPSDLAQYDEVHLAGLEECPAAFTTDAEGWRTASKATIARHLELSESDPGRPILGAFVDDGLIGLLGIQREERRSVSHKAGLWGFYVVPDHRRRGVGRRLVTSAIATAMDMDGLRQLRAVVATTCTSALALFEDVGFEHFGLERDGRIVDGRFHDLAYLWYVVPDRTAIS